MTNSLYRNTLIVVGITAALGLGAAGCGKTANGVVTLTGTVKDSAARSAAETATRSIAGVSSVSNRLSVPSPSVAEAAKTNRARV